jgi:hypothetical protein
VGLPEEPRILAFQDWSEPAPMIVSAIAGTQQVAARKAAAR